MPLSNLCDEGTIAKMKIKAYFLGVVLIFVALAGCSKKPESTGPETGQLLFGVTYQTMNNPFFVDLNEGMR